MTAGPPPPPSLLGRLTRRWRRPLPLPTTPVGATADEADEVPMDVRLHASAEDRLHLLERARATWATRPAGEDGVLGRYTAACARQGVGGRGAASTLLLGADVALARRLRRDGSALVVMDLATSARQALAAALGDEGGGPVEVQPHAWLLHGLETMRVARVVVPAWSLAATAAPLAAELLRMAAHVLDRDGLLYVEADVWRPGHAWRARLELAAAEASPATHVLPSSELFRVLAAEGLLPLDVRETHPDGRGSRRLAVLARRAR